MTCKMKNKYKIIDNYVEIYYTNPKGKNFTIFIDLEDFERVSSKNWICFQRKRANTPYSICSINKKNVLMHRYILKCPDNLICDHINFNGLDNRKSNLRKCTYKENSFNRLPSNSNTSGIRGVSLNKEKKKWIVQLKINKNKRIYKYFESFDDAVKYRKELEKQHWGEFAPINTQTYTQKATCYIGARIKELELKNGDHPHLSGLKEAIRIINSEEEINNIDPYLQTR